MENKEIKKGEIIIYKSTKGPEIEVKLKEETVWLTQAQIALLFSTTKQNVSLHLKKIFKEGELSEKSVVKKYLTTASDKKQYETQFYNLDSIISVGYRVNSKRATQFRVWATKTLKNYLIKGYVINEKRLLSAENNFNELKEAVAFFQEKSKDKLLQGQEEEILSLLANYSKTLTLLEKYDAEKLSLSKRGKGKFELNLKTAKLVISEIGRELREKGEASELFGQEYEKKLDSITGNIYQTFDGKELYGSIEEKAAHLLYLIIKDHPFVDGNKRIGSFLFVYFLDKNKYLYRETGEKKINDNALVALALLIAVSDSKEKDKIIKIVTNILT